MPVVLALVFAGGAVVSLSTSWLLVTRLERVGERLGLSEGLLGVLAALAADSPEITSAITALSHHEHHVGTGVIIGSNVFNLAALLGLGAVAAGRIALHRRVLLFGGTVGVWVAAACLVAVLGVITPTAALAVALAALVPYVVLLGAGRSGLSRLPFTGRWEFSLASAVAQEEEELDAALRPAAGRPADAVLAGGALFVVVVASVAMERAASGLGTLYQIPPIVTGGLVLAAVTSMPNAVAAVYLARRGRGAAMLSTTLNSNALNVVAGLLLPAAVTGLGSPSREATLTAAWYLGLTIAALGLAYYGRGLRRSGGAAIIGAYLVFVAALLAATM